MRWLATIACSCVLLSGCSDDDLPSDDGASSASASAGAGPGGAGAEGGAAAGGSGGTGGAGSGGAGGIEVGATDGRLALPFTLDAQGDGSASVGAVQIAGSVGTVVIGGATLAAVAYERQPFDPYVLYQLLAVDDDRLFVVWLYCQGEALVHLYWEGTDGTALDQELASGTCTGVETASTAQVALPSLSMPYPALLPGYTLEGPGLHYDGQTPGTLDLGAGPMVLLPFEDVDCSDCGMGGWREVHTLLWDPAMGRLCFAIFYLFQPGEPALLTYSLTLPDLSDPAGFTELDATWTQPP